MENSFDRKWAQFKKCFYHFLHMEVPTILINYNNDSSGMNFFGTKMLYHLRIKRFKMILSVVLHVYTTAMTVKNNVFEYHGP